MRTHRLVTSALLQVASLAVVSLIVAAVLTVSAQTPARDAAGPPRSGTGVISGVVLLDAKTRTPLPRASVMLNGPELRVGRTIVTEDDGRFAFTELPPGRFTVSAFKEAYVTVSYGASRPARPGSSIVLKQGERREIELRMPRGGVITGAVTDEDGQPVPGVAVRVLRHSSASGERQLVPSGPARQTDDRGMYRIFGLESGEYVVSANVRPGILGGPDVRPISDADVRTAMQEIAVQGGTGQSRPGVPAEPAQAAAPSLSRPGTTGYAPVYFPGTTVPAQAAMVAVRTGEERAGVDLQLQLVPLARVAGTVSAPRKALAAGAMVTLVASDQTIGGAAMDTLRSTRAAADGMFALNDIPPGRYTLFSRASAPAPAGAAPAAARTASDASALWAMAEVALDGMDVEGLQLELVPGFTVSGRLIFEGTATLPANLARASISLTSLQVGPQVSLGAMPTPPDANGAFAVTGVAPGRYRLNASLSAGAPEQGPWTVKSVTVDGAETLDTGFDLRQDLGDVLVTLTDRPCELSGTVRGAAGEPWVNGYVIAFARDEAFRGRQSRRVRAVRPSTDGRFSLSGLPPGEYLVLAVTDVEQNEWLDPAFLRRMEPSAVGVTLAEGDKKSIELQAR